MARQIVHCPKCNKKVEVVREDRLEAFESIFKTYDCGHTVTEKIVTLAPASVGMQLMCRACLRVPSRETTHELCEYNHTPAIVEIPLGRLPIYSRLLDYQKPGVEFLERANFNAALLDEMGLGKTIQLLYAVKHSAQYFKRVLFVVKASLRLNWAREMMNNSWLSEMDDPSSYPFILLDGKSMLLSGFRYYIVPFSLLAKFKKQIKEMNFNLIVVDESQAFSNMNSQRTEALLEIAATIPHKVCMSGTPILNRASEYFPTLHMVKPDHWNNYASFLRNWIDTEENEMGGKKYRGIKPYRKEAFFAKIAPYVLRRRKRDVLKDLPKFSRHFYVVDVSETNVKNAYNKTAVELDNYINSKEYQRAGGFERAGTILGYLMRMRHLCGVAKSVICVEQAVDFLESTENDTKLIIGVHHDDVMDIVREGLKEYEPVLLPSGIDDITRTNRINQFRSSRHRVCIAKILASGEGLNLQFCQNMIVLERMWNPGKEEQFEARIDRYGQELPTTADYIVAKNTVDEDFSELVEQKRQDCGGSVDKDFDFEMDHNLLSMLAGRAARRRL